MSDKPKFRVMKNGYDRFEVDSTIEFYEKEIRDLKMKLEICAIKLEQSTLIMDELRARYVNVRSILNNKELMAENVSKQALKEANEIIKSAQENADIIIREALAISSLILTDLSRLSGSVVDMKDDVKERINELYQYIEDFKLPELPNIKWLEEVENRMH
ncbi:MAG: hypothetical protein WBH68_04900 [Erysipelotrichaceae bacterium]|jgi:cell division initiation protein|nr:hypothetical protein [Bacillota bacterium]HCY06393.1 hypothetical protein [Erysipelotrichaceae bacterium]